MRRGKVEEEKRRRGREIGWERGRRGSPSHRPVRQLVVSGVFYGSAIAEGIIRPCHNRTNPEIEREK